MGLLKDTIEELGRPAILLGNGINNLEKTFLDWKSLLYKIGGSSLNFDGLTYNEMYDFLEIHNGQEKKMKLKVVKELKSPTKSKLQAHANFVDLAKRHLCPVLTTNFDLALETSKDLSFNIINIKGFTRFYPWEKYASNYILQDPLDDFGIWHIHGVTLHVDSIRLGLTDYMGSVEKARRWIHKGNDRLFKGQDLAYCRGRHTWLHIWFNMPLIIVGLKLESQEVFIRWLLIERERYFRKFEDRRKKTVFLSIGNDTLINNFLSNLNIEHKITNQYKDLYI
jgi:hypothetical protein